MTIQQVEKVDGSTLRHIPCEYILAEFSLREDRRESLFWRKTRRIFFYFQKGAPNQTSEKLEVQTSEKLGVKRRSVIGGVCWVRGAALPCSRRLPLAPSATHARSACLLALCIVATTVPSRCARPLPSASPTSPRHRTACIAPASGVRACFAPCACASARLSFSFCEARAATPLQVGISPWPSAGPSQRQPRGVGVWSCERGEAVSKAQRREAHSPDEVTAAANRPPQTVAHHR